jgi:opacity protein-like surface antigen
MQTRTFLCAIAALLMIAATIPATAQDNRTDTFLGASFTHNGDLPHSFKGALGALTSNDNIGGGVAELSVNVNRWFGLASDLNFSHNGKQNQFLFMGGPEGSFRFKNSRIFAHALVGGAYEVQKLKGFHLTALADSSFAYALGGGLDIGVAKHVAIRLPQVDYIYTEAFHGSESNIRAAAGIVLKF